MKIYKIIKIKLIFIMFAAASYHQESFCASFSVKAVGDGHEIITPKNKKSPKNSKVTFTIKSKKGYKISKLVAGNCPSGKWSGNKYTTGAITKSCKAYFSAGLISSRIVAVTPSQDSNVIVSPNKSEKIITGTLAQFKVTPVGSGYSISQNVGGTCPKGVWLDSIYYKLGPIKKSCTVSFSGTNGNGSGGGGGNSNVLLQWVDAQNNIHIADTGHSVIRKVDGITGIISRIAGTPLIVGSLGDGGPATQAQFAYADYVVVDQAGNAYVADAWSNVVRKIDTSGNISTYAGINDGVRGNSGDGGPATAARMGSPNGLALDGQGNLYIADGMWNSNNVIRKVNTATGIISTVAGNGTLGYSGDGGPATAAQLNQIASVGVDSNGNIFITEFGHNTIRMVDSTTGIISTIAGTGVGGYNGDGILATSAQINSPTDIKVDANNNVFFGDLGNSVIRKIDMNTGLISTVVGIPGQDLSGGDGGPATSATLHRPEAIAFDTQNNLFFAEDVKIRKVDANTGIITTVAGNGSGANNTYPGDDILATTAELASPFLNWD